MRILHVVDVLDATTGGGATERTVQICLGLVKRGHHCTILTTDSGLTDTRRGQLEGIELVLNPCLVKRFHVPALSPRRLNGAVAKADVIHLMNHWTVMNVLVYLAARWHRKPYVVCPAGALPVFGRSRILKRAYNVLFGFRILRHASGHIAITEKEISQFIEYGICRDQVTVVPNGVDAESSNNQDDHGFRKKFGLPNQPIILFMGRLNSIKGPDLLLNAFIELKDALPDSHLVFAGPDEGLRDSLTAVAVDHGVGERVHLIGFLDEASRSQAYHCAQFLVIPSRSEAMSIVALEAGMAGVPVLLTSACGFDEVETVGGGKVVEPTVQGIKDGLIFMRQQNANLKTMGLVLKRHVAQNYTWSSVVDRLVGLFARISR